MSMNDVLSFFYCNLSFSFFIMFAEHLPCPIRIILISGSLLSNQFTLCWVCLIAMDRMLRTIFLQNYATKFNPLRYKITVCIFLAISVLQTGAWIFGALGEPGLGAKLISPLVILSFIAIAVSYTHLTLPTIYSV